MTLPGWLKINDPDGAALRTGARLAVVVGALVVLSNTVIDNPNFASFATFGSFGLLSFADFRGPLRSRFVCGLGFGVAGAAWIVVATVASGHIVASAAVMFIAAFTMSYSAVLGGHIAAASKGMVLAVVLSLMTPGGVSTLGDRLAGWMVAAVVGAVASVVLWPVQFRPKIRTELASVARLLAAHLRRIDRVSPADLEPARQQIGALHRRIDAMLSRPSGPRARDSALLYLLEESGRTADFLDSVIALRMAGSRLPTEDSDTLARAAGVLDGAAAVLIGQSSVSDVAALEKLRVAEMDRVADILRSEEAGATSDMDPKELLDRLDVLFPIRMLTYLALSMSANALVATGRTPERAPWEFQSESPVLRHDRRAFFDRLKNTLAADLTPGSRWFRNAVRAGVALTASVVIANIVQLDRSFWIVLGTLSVLRSSVADTGVTVLQSILGTVSGFAASALVLHLVGGHHDVLWVLLPFVIFIAGYSPKAISFPVAQGAFTLMVVLMMNAAEPVGWAIGLVRVQRVALGVGVSILVALVMWPRGVTHDLAAAVSREFDAAVNHLRTAMRSVLDRLDPVETAAAQKRALAARTVADGELGDLMNSQGTKHIPVDTWSRLVAQPHALVLGGAWLGQVAEHQGQSAVSSTQHATVVEAVGALDHLVDQLDSLLEANRPESRDEWEAVTAEFSNDTVRARRSIERVLSDPVGAAQLSIRQQLGLVWTLQWLQFTGRLDTTLRGPIEEVRAALARSWWH